jgi:hypothetical protein
MGEVTASTHGSVRFAAPARFTLRCRGLGHAQAEAEALSAWLASAPCAKALQTLTLFREFPEPSRGGAHAAIAASDLAAYSLRTTSRRLWNVALSNWVARSIQHLVELFMDM